MGLTPSLFALGGALRAGAVSSVELVEGALAALDQHDGQDRSFVHLYRDDALAAARELDATRRAGIDLGPLHGIPIGVKDNTACREGPTTAQSTVARPGWWAGRDAPVVAALRRAGAVVLGKTRTMEYAIGAEEPRSRNPHDGSRWTGGSSSGSAAAVARGTVAGALGTDTGGSIRMPAAFCGVVGLKPTYGLVPARGVHPISTTLDHVGPLARTARDGAALLDAMAGDAAAGRAGVAPPEGWDRHHPIDLGSLRVGIDRGTWTGNPVNDPALDAVVDDVLAGLRAAGATVVDVAIPLWEEAEIAGELITQAEGYDYHRSTLTSQWERYGPSTRGFLALGALFDAPDLARALAVARAARAAVDDLFRTVDVVVGPTMAMTAPVSRTLDMLEVWRGLYTRYWNMSGSPAVSVPMGAGSDGMPLGLQVAGRHGEDRFVLAVAHEVEMLTTGAGR